MSNTNLLCAVEYEAEANWAENAAFTPTLRPPLLDPIDASGFKHPSEESTRHVQQLQGGTLPVLGVMEATWKERMYLHGHGSATSGALALDPIETYHGFGWGNPSLAEVISAPTRSAANGTTVAAGSTTTLVNTVASGTIARGSLVRIGTSGLSKDARGGGQFYAINNHTGTVLATRHALPAIPNAADVIHSAVNNYLPETIAGTAIKGLRKRFLTPEQKYEVRGCFPKGVTLSGLAPGMTPIQEWDWEGSWWQATNVGAFPSATASNQFNPVPNAGGSFCWGTVGSTVANYIAIRDFSISIALGIVPLPGHSGVHPNQRYVGARRTPSKITGSFTFDAEVTGTNTFEALRQAGTKIWWTNSLSTAIGASLGMHAQNCCITGEVVQTAVNGINSFVVPFACYAGADLATELSQAAFVMAVA